MAPATEIAFIELTPGADPTDESNPAWTVLQDAQKTIMEQPGYQRMAWGITEEAKNMLLLLIDWDNIEAHHAFMKAPHYQPFVGNLGKVLAAPPAMMHVSFPEWSHPTTNAMSKWASPVTECFVCYYPTDKVTPELHKEIDEKRNRAFQAACAPVDSQIRSVACAWAIEDEIERDGKKYKPYACLLGWDSVEAHMKTRETKVVQESLSLIRDGNYEATNVYHVKFNIV